MLINLQQTKTVLVLVSTCLPSLHPPYLPSAPSSSPIIPSLPPSALPAGSGLASAGFLHCNLPFSPFSVAKPFPSLESGNCIPQFAWMWSFLTTHPHLQMPQEAQDRSPSKPFNWKFPFAWDRSLSLVRSTKTVQSLNGEDQDQQLVFILLLNFVEYGKCSQLSGFPENTRNHFGKLFSNFSAFAFSFWSAMKLDCSSGKLEAIWFWSVAPSFFWSAPFPLSSSSTLSIIVASVYDTIVMLSISTADQRIHIDVCTSSCWETIWSNYPILNSVKRIPSLVGNRSSLKKSLIHLFFGTFYLETVSMTSSSSLRVFSQASPRRLN